MKCLCKRKDKINEHILPLKYHKTIDLCIMKYNFVVMPNNHFLFMSKLGSGSTQELSYLQRYTRQKEKNFAKLNNSCYAQIYISIDLD